METANCVLALNAMVLNVRVLFLRGKAMVSCDLASCSLVQGEKGSYGQETSFLKALNSMAECMLGLNAMGLSSYNCSRESGTLAAVCERFH
jgi:hypothetical protein